MGRNESLVSKMSLSEGLSIVTNEVEWTRKYKRALLERERSQRMRRIQEAKDAMAERRGAIDRESPERNVIDRAMDILATLREFYVSEHP